MRDESVAGMIGTSSASATSKTFSDTSEMLGGQSRNVYSYSPSSGARTLRSRLVGFLASPSARSMWR